jgi:hypothetical protein
MEDPSVLLPWVTGEVIGASGFLKVPEGLLALPIEVPKGPSVHLPWGTEVRSVDPVVASREVVVLHAAAFQEEAAVGAAAEIRANELKRGSFDPLFFVSYSVVRWFLPFLIKNGGHHENIKDHPQKDLVPHNSIISLSFKRDQ